MSRTLRFHLEDGKTVDHVFDGVHEKHVEEWLTHASCERIDCSQCKFCDTAQGCSINKGFWIRDIVKVEEIMEKENRPKYFLKSIGEIKAYSMTSITSDKMLARYSKEYTSLDEAKEAATYLLNNTTCTALYICCPVVKADKTNVHFTIIKE